MSDIEIVRGCVPGSLGRVASLHGTYYSEHWGFGLFFEAKVATELSEFLAQYHEDRDGFWVAAEDGAIQGSIAIDGSRTDTDGAHLRWFIVSEDVSGAHASESNDSCARCPRSHRVRPLRRFAPSTRH